MLLDTHALLWVLLSPNLLSTKARRTLADPSNTLFVSSASAWEIATKHSLGKLPEAEEVVHGYQSHLRTLGATELAISSAHALSAGGLRHKYRDPFDRIIAAQSILESLPLVSADPVFRDLAVTVMW